MAKNQWLFRISQYCQYSRIL